MKEQLSLSPTKLNDFVKCSRCFHDTYVSKIVQPRIVAGIMNGMDRTLKNYVDQFRGSIPHGLGGQLPGVLMADMVQMKIWRHWTTGPTFIDKESNVKLIGALDDCLDDRYVHVPLDWKTKGQEPDTDGSEYYQLQMDCYNLMLDAQGVKTRDEAYLCYTWPMEGKSTSTYYGQIRIGAFEVLFGLKVFKLACSKDRALETLRKAAECMRGPRPESNPECEQCKYLSQINQLTAGIGQEARKSVK
jgi:hypothetical protein